MTTKRFVITLTVLLLAVFTFVSPIAAQQQPPPPSQNLYTGIDILFVVDQSGSMSGLTRQNSQGSDPNGLRFQSMQFAMGWLGDFKHSALTDDAAVRMSVIAFGDPQRTVTLDWTALSPTGFDTDRWNLQRVDLEDILSEDFFGANVHFGYTNFENALILAQSQFDDLPPLAVGQNNLRVIMIITDGEPCAVSDIDENQNCSNENANLRQLQRTSNFTQRAFPPPNYELYILAIENPSEPYWTVYSQAWEPIVRDLVANSAVVNTAEDMAVTVQNYLQTLASRVSSAQVSRQIQTDADGRATIDIPPYVGRINFNVFKSALTPSGANTITLTKPDGAQLIGTDADVTVTGSNTNIERWRIQQPDPGTWTIQLGDPQATVELSLDQSYVQSRLLGIEDIQSPTYYQWQAIPLEPLLYYPVGSTEIPVTLLPAYPMQMTAHISGATTIPNLQLPENVSGTSQAQFAGQFIPINAGDYTVALSAIVPNIQNPINQGQVFSPLDTRTSPFLPSFTVEPSLVTVQVSPTLNQNGNWIEDVPGTVCVLVQDSITRSQLSNLDHMRVTATFYDQANAVQSVPLTYQSTSGSGCSFLGDVAPPAPGNYALRVEGFITQPDGTEIEVFNQSSVPPPPTQVVVDPVRRIELRVVEPQESPSDSNVIEPRPFWSSQPLRFAVIAYDAQNNLVDLTTLVAGNEPPLQLTITDGRGTNVTDGLSLTRVSSFRYELETDQLGRGAYSFSVTGAPLDRVNCECAYASIADGQTVEGNQASQIINRVFPIIVFAQIGVILGAILLVILLVFFVYRRYADMTNAPLSGDIVIYEELYDRPATTYLDELTRITLDTRFNRTSIGKNQIQRLPNDLESELKSIFATTDGNEKWAEEGTARVIIRFNKKKEKAFTLRADAEPKVFYEGEFGRYLIAKDPDLEAAMFGE